MLITRIVKFHIVMGTVLIFFIPFVSVQLFTKRSELGEVCFFQLVQLNYLDSFKFSIFIVLKRLRDQHSTGIVWIVDNCIVIWEREVFSMMFSFLKNSHMVDRTVLCNDRTVLFKVWTVTRLIFEKFEWQKCPFIDRSVLYTTEVSFFLFGKQNCPFHLLFWPEVSFSQIFLNLVTRKDSKKLEVFWTIC